MKALYIGVTTVDIHY